MESAQLIKSSAAPDSDSRMLQNLAGFDRTDSQTAFLMNFDAVTAKPTPPLF
jgi:hypothetical protein